jgi:hypothetical protein
MHAQVPAPVSSMASKTSREYSDALTAAMIRPISRITPHLFIAAIPDTGEVTTPLPLLSNTIPLTP